MSRIQNSLNNKPLGPIKNQNKTERRAPSRDVQPRLSCKPLSGAQESSWWPCARDLSTAVLLRVSPPGIYLCKGLQTSNKVQSPLQLPPPVETWAASVRARAGFLKPLGLRDLQLRILPSSVSFLSIFLHNMVAKHEKNVAI